MTPASNSTSEADLIRQEISAAKDAIDRYHELTTTERRIQAERLKSIEQRLENLEKATESLRQEILGVVDSRIWRSLVKGGKLIAKVGGGGTSR